MKARLSLLTRKVFALIIATSMSIPTNVFASEPGPENYEEDSSIMGLAQNETTEEIRPAEIDSSKQVETSTYLIDIRGTLDESLTKIDYTIRLKRKNSLAEGEDKDFSLSLVAMPNINSLRLVSASAIDADQERDLAADTSDDDLNSLILKNKAHDEIIYNLSADIRKAKDGRTYDLALGLAEDTEDVIAYKLKAKEEEDLESGIAVNTIKLVENDARNLEATYRQGGILGGILAKHDYLDWTDFIANDTQDVKEIDYDLKPDQNQITDETKIRLDYYKMSPNGFVINKEFSQEIDFAEKIKFEIPKSYLAKLSLTTKVDKKNTKVKAYKLNNREIKNPIYIEGSEEENKEEGDDPAPAEENQDQHQEEEAEKPAGEENKDAPAEKPQEETSDRVSTEEKEEKEANPSEDKKEEAKEENKEENKEEADKEQDKQAPKEEPAEKISGLVLNRDSLQAKLKEENRLTEELKTSLEEITSRLDAYDKDQITWEDLLNYTKALVERDKLTEADLREIIGELITGLNKETYKSANINIDEIIKFVYPAEAENHENENKEKEPSDLEKADKELKEALADKSKGIEEIQALLSSFEEKYNLSREDQEKLMTDNNDAINALVEKDRKENFRPLNLMASNSWDDKVFNLKTEMNVKASKDWPIPSGWYFDVNLGPYLKEHPGQPLNDLYHDKLGLVATAQMLRIGNDNVIRYTYIRRVTESIKLDIDQNLAFDKDAIGYQDPITINIKVAPKNNPVQDLYPITVSKDQESPVKSSYIVEDQGEYKSGTYPYQLNWETTSQKLRDKNHNEIKSMIDPNLDGAYVDWDIVVDTKDLIQSKENLDFNKLHLTVFGSANQGLKDFSYKVSTSPIDVNDTKNFKSSSRLGEILTQDSEIEKKELGDKLYIKVRGKIDPDEVHETYSIGFRINPDKNYIDHLLEEYKEKFDKIPSPIKWLKGVKDAKRFAEVPFNLVETMIPATFTGLRDKFTNERFYYDNTRTIVADRKSDNRADWYALDLIRRGENQDPALDYPTFDLNNGTNNQNIKANKIYFVPIKDGGYRRTSQAGDVVLSNGQYYPGTLVSYEYENEKGQRNDAYNFRADLKDKKKFNIDEVYDTEGGMVNLFTQKVSDQAIANGYLAYTEDPYPIMRIDKNFDMVSCFNDRIKAPVYTGSKSVILDKHEDASGDFLISRLNESINKKSGDYELKKYLNGTEYDGVFLNHGGMSEGQAMEELMKKIYFYGEEVKKDYAKKHGGKEMHRLIESSMYQRVIHHFTDGKSLKEDYFQAPSSYNVDEWKVPHTLSGTRQTYPKTGWDGSFDGADKERKTDQGLRKLKDNETRIANYPPVQSTQYDMAVELYNKVIASYKDEKAWDKDKADSVKLVFYSHTDEGKYQELIAGRVMAPIEIDKYKQDGKKLKDAKFRFTNIDTGENKTWTSKDDENTHKLYLRPGKYKVQEIKTPDGYQKIEDFDIEVIREEIYPDDGPYRAKKLDHIHVNDGFKTKVALGDNIPETVDHQKLVELDGNNIKVKIKNIDDNLGSLEFTKKNKFIRLRGAEFRLRKLKDTSVDKAKKDINSLTDEDFDSDRYDQTSAGDGGGFKFEQIPVGYFVLEETKVPTGYQKAPLYLLQGVKGKDDNDKDTVIVSFVGENTPNETENKKTIIRNKLKETEIKFRKIREPLNADETEKIGLTDARFRLESLWTKDGSTYLKDVTSDALINGSKEDRASNTSSDKGYFLFKNLIVGDYKLTEIQAPYGYQVTDTYWRVEVREDEDGNLRPKVIKITKDGNTEKEEDFNPNTESIYEIENKARKISIDFKKYLGELEKDSEGKPKVKKDEVNKKLKGENNEPVSFDLYNSDFYGAIIGDKDEHGNIKPIKTGIIQDDEGIFHLNDLEFGKYYILRETNPPAGYEKANDILLKVEAEAVANVGQMKVIVRDPNANTEFGEHAIFKGVIDFKKGEQLGSFTIKKTGNAISYINEKGELVTIGKENPKIVGLRRAYFRLYTANSKFEIEKNGAYAKEYIQKVTPGVPIILYLTKEDADKLKTSDPKAYAAMGIAGSKEFQVGENEYKEFAIDGKGNRIRIGEDPNSLPHNQGIVTFDNLKPGYYVLEEFRGPAGYERTTQKWYVKVEDNGRTIRSENIDDPAFSGQGLQARSIIQDPSMSPRLKMAGLDISEPVQFNKLMSSPMSDRLEIGDQIGGDPVGAGGWEYVDPNRSRNKTTSSTGSNNKTKITEINKSEGKYRQIFLVNMSGEASTKSKFNFHAEPPNRSIYYKKYYKNDPNIKVLSIKPVESSSTIDNIKYIGTETIRYGSEKVDESGQYKRYEFRLTKSERRPFVIEVEYDYPESGEIGLGLDYYTNAIFESTKTWAAEKYTSVDDINYKTAGPKTETKQEEVRTTIPIPTEPTRRPNSEMFVGDEREVFAGKEGYKIDIYEFTYIDGVRQDNPKFIRNKETVEPQAKVVEYGTKQKPGQTTYTVSYTKPENGTLSGPLSATSGQTVTVTATPNQGYIFGKISVSANGKPVAVNGNQFTMPESDVTVSATFVLDSTQPSQGDKNLEVNFTYSGSKDGNVAGPDDKSPGKLELFEEGNEKALEEIKAVNQGTLPFKTKLDSNKSYKLIYTRQDTLAKAWALPNQSIYKISSELMQKAQDTIKLTIANGNTMDIFNVDETGFRIPLRITKVNENKGVLTGAQFRAVKILKGDKIPVGDNKEDYPVYGKESFDGVSEATGLPGDNYFRELSPGLYELSEIKTPNGTYRLPKDENGKDKKWYFKVEIGRDKDGNYKKPSDYDYMVINFKFKETLPSDPKDERWAIPETKANNYKDKEIRGIDFGEVNGKRVFDHFTEIIKDDHRSDPARPDAPYKGIDDVRVTNYLKTTELNFSKKDLASYENIEGAEFTLKKADLDKNGNIQFGLDGNPKFVDLNEKRKDKTGKETYEFVHVQPKPYDIDVNGAKNTSSKSAGVSFTNIEQGTYILQETKPAEGYKLEDNFLAIKFTTDENGAWKQEITAYQKDGNGYKKLENTSSLFQKDANENLDIVFNNKSYIGLKFQKIEGSKKGNEEVEVKSADFKLTQVDENGKKIEGGYEKTIYSYDNSVFEFKYLPVGHYKLQETRAISKFEKPDPWFFEVKQDDKTHKLKIVFKNHDASVSYTPIDQSEDGKNSPVLELDKETNLERPKDLKIRNYSKTNFSFQKLKNEIDEKTKEKLPLKDAYFRLTKVRFSMDEKAKSYEYHNEKDGAGLKKYVHGKKVTEYDPKGNVEKFTYDNKEYKYDKNKNLISVGGQTPTEEDKKVEPDAISNATGKYSALRRSQSTGRVDFQNLGEGIYQLEEVGIPEGYQSDTKQFKWIFKVEKTDDGLQIRRTYKDKQGNDHNIEEEYFKKYDKGYYNNVYLKNKFKENSNIEGDGKTNPYKITNTKTTTELKWKKIGSKENTTPIKKDTKFVMLKTTDNPADIDSKDQEKVKAAISGQSEYPPYQIESTDGTFIVTDLAKGVYNLIETKAPDGYEKINRKIAIKIYEDKEGLKKQFYEITEDGKLVKNIGSFEAILNNSVKVNTDKDGYFHVINKQKPYFFYLSKGFMKNVDGKEEFTDITKGKLKIKIYADPDDKENTDDKVYEQTIDLSDEKSYRVNVDGIQTGVNYLLEEVEAPDGYVKTNYRYRLKFAYNNSWNPPFVATLMAVLKEVKKEDGTKTWVPLQNDKKQNISDSNQLIAGGQNIGTGFTFRIVNKKAEVVFTKFGEDEKAEGGKKPLKDVKFYLEKQDPDDIDKENKGYYPLTKDWEFIKSQPNRNGDGLDYYIEKYVNGEKKTYFYYDNKIVNIENFAKIYTSGEDGKFKITDLTDGYYRVIEPEAPEYEKGKKYMKVNGPIKTFRVVNGKVYIYTKIKEKDGSEKVVEKEIDETNKDELGKIINEKPGKGEFELTKVDENGDGLKNVEFTLHKTDADETKVGEQTTGSDGKVKFTDLPYGYYWLKETKTKDGYILDTKKRLIALGGDKEWKVPEKPKDDVSKAIKFEGTQDQLVSTEDSKRTSVVYPNKAEGIFAKFKFKIDEKADIKPGDHFTIKFSDNVDLDGINKDYDDKGQKGDQYFNIIGPAGLLAKAKVNDDRRSITYTFTEYVKDYKPESMSMFLQLFPNRRKVDHKQDITVTADIGNNIDTNSNDYHYSDSINIDYRGYNDKGKYNGYQNPTSDISSYMLRLDPEHKTFTAIVYYNPWNKYLTNKNITFTADEDIILKSLSVKTYRKSGWGSHRDEWKTGDLPDSYDVDFRKNLTYISDFYRYEPRGNGNTRKIYIPNDNLTQNGYNTNTYVIEIKGQLAGKDVKSLKTRVDYIDHNVFTQINGYNYYQNTYTGNFETWSQFFNPGASGNVNKEIKLVNFKNKIEFAKVDGGVLSNVVDKTEENPQNLKDLGIGNPLKGAEFKLVKDGTDVDKSARRSDQDGIFSWEGLAPGTYQVIETKSPDKEKYDLPKDAISTFEVDKDGNIVNIKENKQILENYRKAEIKIRKTDQEGSPLNGAKFLLTPEEGLKDPSDPSKPFPALTKPDTDNESIATFSNLVAGKYTLTEERAPKGYTKSDKKWEIEVTKDGKVKWTNSFDDGNDQMKEVTGVTYSGDDDKENLKSEILGIDQEAKTFRQKITIKARPSDLEKARLILDSVSTDLKLSQTNTKVRLVQADKTGIKAPDNSSYTVEINNGNTPNLTLRITPPYREEKKNNPVGSSEGQSGEQTQKDADKEREYIFIVDMPYKDDARIGAKATYEVGKVDTTTGKVTFDTKESTTSLDKYLAKENYKIGTSNVSMDTYKDKYLARDINLLTTDIGNIKQPNIYFKKIDADDKTKGLQGAKFELQTSEGDSLSPKRETASDENGNFSFENIPDGEYRIFETKAPSGYSLMKKDQYYFKVENGKIYKADKDGKVDDKEIVGKDDTKPNSETNPIQIENRKAEYPYTGGPGTWIGFTLAGLAVMLGGVFIFFKRKEAIKG